MKKTSVLVMLTMMTAVLFTGCGKETKEPAAEEAVQQESVTESTAVAEEAVSEATQEATVEEPGNPTSLDDAIIKAVFDYNDQWFDQGELAAEGHILMDKDEGADGTVFCYTLTSYGRYEFQDGNFVIAAGSGSIPTVITLEKNEEGEYITKNFEEALDGDEFVDSIKDLFPESLWNRCISIEAEDDAELESQKVAYAEEYLSSIGRDDAQIGEYADFEHKIFSDFGVSDDVSNKLIGFEEGSFENNCPFWVGNREVIEDDVRYIYETAYDDKAKEIIYSKTEYESGEVVEKSVYDAKTGDKIEK